MLGWVFLHFLLFGTCRARCAIQTMTNLWQSNTESEVGGRRKKYGRKLEMSFCLFFFVFFMEFLFSKLRFSISYVCSLQE